MQTQTNFIYGELGRSTIKNHCIGNGLRYRLKVINCEEMY